MKNGGWIMTYLVNDLLDFRGLVAKLDSCITSLGWERYTKPAGHSDTVMTHYFMSSGRRRET